MHVVGNCVKKAAHTHIHTRRSRLRERAFPTTRSSTRRQPAPTLAAMILDGSIAARASLLAVGEESCSCWVQTKAKEANESMI